MLQPKGKCEVWRKPTLPLARNVGDNHEVGGKLVLAERDLVASNETVSGWFLLCSAKQDFLYA